MLKSIFYMFKAAVITLFFRLVSIIMAIYLIKPIYFVTGFNIKYILLTNVTQYKELLKTADVIWGVFFTLFNLLILIYLWWVYTSSLNYNKRVFVRTVNIKIRALLGPIENILQELGVWTIFNIVVLVFIFSNITKVYGVWYPLFLPAFSLFLTALFFAILINKQINIISLYNMYAPS